MTKAQLEYIYKRVRRGLKKLTGQSLSRTEFKGFLGMMGINTSQDIFAHEFSEQLIGQLTQMMSESAVDKMFETGTPFEQAVSAQARTQAALDKYGINLKDSDE